MPADGDLNIAYDSGRDVVTIEGVQYSGHLFRSLGLRGFEPGTWLRIEQRADGLLTVYSVPEETERSFDAIAGRGIAAMPK